ncbi:peptidase M4 [Sporolactobacillus pectinivorans]|uniref:peptidase M4 n=1 Tax=Sporolactobacillus pectinivorans TaxID=1591408 RepID=UPI000C26A9B6|nr:peptidase M4 [Sporolactobacillus pectinivorans]
MKNWIITGVLAVLLIAGFGSWYLYTSNMDTSNSSAQAAIVKAKRYYQVQKVDSVSYYYGTDAYEVVKCVRNSVQMYVWVPDEPQKAKYIVRAVKNGITRNQALQELAGLHLNVNKIISVKLGAIQNSPVWEITFTNNTNSYNYVSFYFDNGKEAQRILNV